MAAVRLVVGVLAGGLVFAIAGSVRVLRHTETTEAWQTA